MDEPEQFWKPIPPYDDRGWDLVPPIEECGEPLVDITGRTPRILCGASYLRQGLDGALDRCWVREGMWERLRCVLALLPERYSLLIFDGLRPLRVQRAIYGQFKTVIQEERPGISAAELELILEDYVARPVKRLDRPAPHTTGGAVDLTLCLDGTPMDMGTGFDNLTSQAHTDWFERTDGGRETMRDQRRLLFHVMEAAGFVNYGCEWWHYSYGDRQWARQKKGVPIYGFCPECDG